MQNTNKRKGYPFIRSGDINKSAGSKKINESYRPFHTAIETGRTRLLITATILSFTFIAVGAKVVDLATLQDSQKTTKKHFATQPGNVARADITDRNGNIVATNLSMASLFADPRNILEPNKAAKLLAKTLPGLDREKITALLKRKRKFVWIKRHLTPRQQQEVNQLGIPGLDFRREHKRFYPHGALMAHSLGYSDIDNRGIAGIEKHFNTRLENDQEPLKLSLDLRVQHKLRIALAEAMFRHRAAGAAGIVMDVTNGKVIAIVSAPDFDPNNPGKAPTGRRFNRASHGVYELGSTFKILTAAIALDAGIVSLQNGYDATRPIKISGFTINDHYGKRRWLSVPEIFIYSSNIGAGHMALDTGAETQKFYLHKLGLLHRAAIELPEVGAPIVPRNWRRTQTVTIAFGHGISVSPLQLTAAIAASVNGGIFHKPTVVENSHNKKGKRVFTEATSRKMRQLLRLSVLEGTGKAAAARGYLVGGKTGSAEKRAVNGYDKDLLISSFVGVFPMIKPRYAIFAMLDEPVGTEETQFHTTGGWVAAPIVGKVIQQIAPILNVVPVDENTPSIRKALTIRSYKPTLEARTLASFKAH
ncbi:MAG: penicillin-binding protein [Rhodospirillaceae bacterium]|nr:penicillin-binding protein [Rhodospirillaceae bacterium]